MDKLSISRKNNMGSGQSRNVPISNNDEIDVGIPIKVIINTDMHFHYHSYDLIQYCKHLHTSGLYSGQQCSREVVPGFQYCQECMSQVSKTDYNTDLIYLV